MIVAQCYINDNIKYIFIPEDVVQYKDIQKFMPFNEQSKQNFQNSFDEILRQNNLPSGGIDRNQFCFLIKKIYGATIIDEKSTLKNKLSQICSSEEIGQMINDEKQVCFLIDGEQFFIPKDECGVIILASFSNEKLISLKYSFNGFKYATILYSLIDVDECMKLLI